MIVKYELDYFLDLLDKANLIVATKYTQGSPEFIRTNKEQVALMLELNELKKTNKLILEELIKLNSNKEVTKPATVTKKETK